MRSVGSLLLPALILAAGGGGAYCFRKSSTAELDVPLLHAADARPNRPLDLRARGQVSPHAGPVPAAPLHPPTPRLLGRIQEESPGTRPLGLTKDEPPRLPPLFFTGNGAWESGSLEGLDP